MWSVQVSPSDTGNVLTLTTVYSVNHTVALWDMPAGQRLFTYTKNTSAHTPQNTTQLIHLLLSVFIHINIHTRSINTLIKPLACLWRVVNNYLWNIWSNALCELIFQRENCSEHTVQLASPWRIQAYANIIEHRHIPLLRVQPEPLYEV